MGLIANAGQQRAITVYSGNGLSPTSVRWLWILRSGVAEPGANVGCDIALSRYDDTGAVIDQPLTITRSTGEVDIRTLHASTFCLNLPTPIGRQTVTGAWAGNTAGKALCVALAAFVPSPIARQHEGNGTMSGSPDYTLTPNSGCSGPTTTWTMAPGGCT